jgi:hypothetical protein
MAPILSKYNLTIESINTPGTLISANQYTQLILDVDSAVKDNDFCFFLVDSWIPCLWRTRSGFEKLRKYTTGQ